MLKTLYPDCHTIEKERRWHLLDVKDKILGRTASKIAVILMGKHKANWSPHLECGDFVVVTNASKIRITGNKLTQKHYFKHSGYPDGARLVSVKKLLQERPTEVLRLAVKRMLPKNKLADRMISHLKIYADERHPHQAQNPIPLS